MAKPAVSTCLPSFPPLVHHHGTKSVPDGTQLLVPFLPIACSGHITSWTMMVKHHHHNRSTIHFQIWRQEANDTDTYYLLGSNVFEDLGPTHEPHHRHHLVTLPVQDKDQLVVEAGDFVGLFLSGGKGGVEVEARHQHGHRVLYYTTSEAAAELTLSLGTSLPKHNRPMKWKDLVPVLDFTGMCGTMM